MKIIHTGDIHLESRLTSNFSSKQAEERNDEIIKNFENLINSFAKENDVKIVLLAGDLFDSDEAVNGKIVKRVEALISQNPEIEFLYLRGNHDKKNVLKSASENLKNLKFFSEDKWTCYKKENICIYGREYFKSIPQSDFDEIKPAAEFFNIVCLHGQIVKNTNKETAPFINVAKFKNKNIDYLALGHIHSFQTGKIDERGRWAYCGCLEGRGFDETGEKGFVLLDIDEKNNCKYKFVSYAKRTVHEIKIQLFEEKTFSEILNSVKKNLIDINKNDLVKIILSGEVDEACDADIILLEKTLKDEFYFFKIENNLEVKINYEKFRNDVSLKGEFVRTVENSNLTESEKIKIIMTGLKALSNKSLG